MTTNTARVFVNHNRNVFLLVRTNEDTNDYLTMGSGIIDLVTIDQNQAKEDLKATRNSFPKAIDTFIASVLPKTDKASRILAKAKADPSQDDFVTGTAATTKKAKKVKAPSPRKAEGVFTLADLAKEQGLNPREVRAKFRKLMAKPEGGWIFANDRRDEILQMMMGKEVKPVVQKKAPVTKKPAKAKITKAQGVVTKRKPIKKAA